MKLKLTRVSAMPTRTGSFVYRVEDPAQIETIAEGKEISGIYDAQDGTKLLYSRSRLGNLNVPFDANIRLNGTPDGRTFINLIDTSMEKAAETMYDQSQKLQLSRRFFGANTKITVDLGNGVHVEVGAEQAATPAVTPVPATPAAPIAEEHKEEVPA